MSWEEREYASDAWRGLGRPGGDWRGIRPTLDNPFTWSIAIGRVSGILIRIHVIFLLFILVELLQAAGSGASDATSTLWLSGVWMTALFVMVLLHEFGHCLACRWSAGEANEILMWPLGGLAYCQPPDRWQAHFATAAGGPLVNILFFLVMAPMLGAATGRWWGVAVFNPLDPFAGYALVSHSTLLRALYLVNHANLLILAFNLFLPMFPFDGGRLIQAVLWSRFGYQKSMRFALRLGYVGAIVLGIGGMVSGDVWLVGIAFFGGVTCYITHKQLQWASATTAAGGDEYTQSLFDADEKEAAVRKPSRRERRAARQARREQSEGMEVDRILQKIADRGIGSLTWTERRILRQATNRKRHER